MTTSAAMRMRRAGSPMNTGLSMLIPQAYDACWTRIDDGVFNDYPPLASSDTDGVLSAASSAAESDATFGQAIPIPFTVSTQNALIAANSRRGFLLIQNNSGGQSGDTLPNLYVTFDGPVATSSPIAQNLVIAPGAGIVFDRRPPGNAIYVKWGTFTNTSGLAVAGGVLWQGLLPVD